MKNKKEVVFPVRMLAVAATLSALSIVLGKYLAINLGTNIRISFENLPIILAGFYFGPWIGGAVGIVADLVGCLLVGYSINPIITFGAASIGILAGVGGLFYEKKRLLSLIASTLFPHIIGSLLIKTAGLYVFYHSPFFATLGWRALTYSVIIVAEFLVISILSSNRAFHSIMVEIKPQKAKKASHQNGDGAR